MEAQAQTAPPLRLLIVDDQPLIRRALAMILGTGAGIEVVGQASDGQVAIDMAMDLRPDVVVMDLQMPRLDGVAATREITSRLTDTRVVVLTTFDDDELVFDAIRSGAHAYLLKDANEEVVLDTVRAVHRGESRLSPAIAGKVLEWLRAMPTGPLTAIAGGSGGPAMSDEQGGREESGPALDALTEKEQRVLDLLAQGLTNKQIGASVFLAEGTVKNYVSRIMDKLHVRTRAELAVRATTGR